MTDIPTKLERLFALDAEIDQAEAALKTLKSEKERLETQELPALFADQRVQRWTMDNGAQAIKSLVASGSLPKEPEQRQQALQWLDANDYGGMLEAKVVASWNRGHRDRAKTEYNRLRGDNSVKVIYEEGMNHMTLGKQMKERIQRGLAVPMSLLGISIIPRVRFTTRGNDNGNEHS